MLSVLRCLQCYFDRKRNCKIIQKTIAEQNSAMQPQCNANAALCRANTAPMQCQCYANAVLMKAKILQRNANAKQCWYQTTKFLVNDDRRRRKILRSRAAPPQAAGSQKSSCYLKICLKDFFRNIKLKTNSFLTAQS